MPDAARVFIALRKCLAELQSSSVDESDIHLISVKRWTIILSMNTPPKTFNHGSAPPSKNFGQAAFPTGGTALSESQP
jgi:hypothetical protein